METEKMENIRPGSPFWSDAYHMGTQIAKNVFVMYESHRDEIAKYIIVVNADTGERLKVTF